MFENIGRSQDEEQGKRRAASAGLTSILLASLIGGFWVGVVITVTGIPDPLPETPMVFLVDPIAEPEPIAAPAPPAPPPERVKAAGGESDAPVPTDHFIDDVKALDSEPAKKITDLKTGGPGTKGPGEGECEGTDCIESTVIGDPNGMGKATKRIHRLDVDRRRVINPVYPRAAKPLGLGTVRCKVLVTIDGKGVPTDAVVEDCPLIFHPESKDAMLRSRWYAPVVDGQRLNSAAFLVVIKFDMR